jgi:hypothetical protein
LSIGEDAEMGETLEPGDEGLFRPLVLFPTNFPGGDPAMYRQAEEIGIEVSTLTDQIGISLRCQPPHLIAQSDFDVGDAETNPSLVLPKYDYRKMLATLAFPGTHRIQLVSFDDVLDESAGTKVIDVPGAHCWYLAEGTVYGVDRSDATGKTLLATEEPLIVRDDRERLSRVMAGAIARYRRNRYRAVIHVHGLASWHQYLGHLISTINDGTTDTADLKSPITGVEWEFEREYRSIIRTGYAE